MVNGSISLDVPDATGLPVFACDLNGIMLERGASANAFNLQPEFFYYFIHHPDR